MSRLPPGFGGGFSQNATSEQQNTFEMPGQNSGRQRPISGFWGGQQHQQNNRVENNPSAWDIDPSFASLPPRRSANSAEVRSNSSVSHEDDKLESTGPGKAYNYAAAAASGGNARKDAVGVAETQTSQQINNISERQFRTTWVSNAG